MSNIDCPISTPSDPPSILNDLVKRIQKAIPLDQTIPFWNILWKKHLMSVEGERLRSQKAAIIEYAASCSSLSPDEIHFSSACELLFDLVLILAQGSEEDWYDRLSTFQLMCFKKYFAHFNIALKACDGEVEGHESAASDEHELLDCSDLSDLTESEPEYSGPQSIILIKFRNFNTFLKDTFLSNKSAQELKMSRPTFQPKGPRQKPLETACYPTAHEAINLLRLELAHHLKVIKELQESTSSQIRTIIRTSELPSTIAQITNPQYLVAYTTESRFSFRAQIYQQTALFHQLGTILNKWTPLEVRESWSQNAPKKIEYLPSGLGNLMLPTGAAAFFKLLAQKPILPLKAFPFVVLFLIGGESNFDFWWSHSIAPALDYFGYKVESSPPKGLYSKLIGYLKPQSAMSKIEKDGLTESTLAYTPHGLIMAKILKNSVEYFQFEHEVSSYMKKFHIPHPEDAGNMSLIDYYNNCAICCTKPLDERCTTVLQVQFLNQLELEKRFPGLIHGGVTSVLDPVQIGVGTMYDYKDLQLHKICKDQQKIACCGQHRWIITTGDPTHPRQKEDKVEMVLFDAFSNSCLKRMIVNFNHSTEVAALQRQGRVGGDMIPFGTRVPKGGAPGDGLRPFEGINATTISGVDEFFAQAENAMAYDKVAKYLDPDLYHEIQRRTMDSEKLGRIGGTVYSCHNYMAIQHFENTDACRSFCSQLELVRNHQYEMAFVYSQMGYWIETESNTFWTFDASLVHGTMLPAEKTAAQMRSRTRLRDGQPAGGGGDVPVSNGQHKPTRETDNRRAAEHVRNQREREQRDAYWNIAE